MIETFEIESRLKVMTPTGHEGRLDLTRREIKLIDSGHLSLVQVMGTDGLTRNFDLSELSVVKKEEPKIYMTKEEFIVEINCADTVDELKDVVSKMAEQLF